MPARDPFVDVVIVGAGPCGLAAAIAAQRAGLTAVIFDRGPIVSGIASYPTFMTFFSTAERIAIGGLPFIVAAEKPSRRDALAYYRAVASHFDLDVRQFETVEAIAAVGAGAEQDAPARARWRVTTRRRSGVVQSISSRAVVVATGYFGRPNRLGVPGESLPHVHQCHRHTSFIEHTTQLQGRKGAVSFVSVSLSLSMPLRQNSNCGKTFG